MGLNNNELELATLDLISGRAVTDIPPFTENRGERGCHGNRTG